MASHAAIDAQFDRAVEIVQGLPKTGPIQTGYEEKLTMYSLYKQATVGNVTGPRPGMWDMLGRAKWDAWAKHKDLQQVEAKWLYVEALLKVLRKYSDKTVARDLVREIESFGGGDPSDLVLSRSLSEGSDSSGSTTSLPLDTSLIPTRITPPRQLESASGSSTSGNSSPASPLAPLPQILPQHTSAPISRSHSSASTHPARYRTAPPSMTPTIPAAQPHPGYETQSAFSAPSPSTQHQQQSPYSSYVGVSGSYIPYSAPIGSGVYQQQQLHASGPLQISPPYAMAPIGRPPSTPARPGLELVIQRMQAHLAALGERLDALEARALPSSPLVRSGSRSPSWLGGSGVTGAGGSNNGLRGGGDSHDAPWDPDELGLWALAVRPFMHLYDLVAYILRLVAYPRPDASPTRAVVRRLLLDLSFLVCCAAAIRAGWKRSAVRRRDVRAALGVLWRALMGAEATAVRAIGGVQGIRG